MTSSVITSDAAFMRGVHEMPEVLERAVIRVDVLVIGDVVAVIAQRRRIERQQPDAGDAEARHVIELGVQPREIADAVVVGIEERLHVELVDDGVFVPKRIVGNRDLGRSRHIRRSLQR